MGRSSSLARPSASAPHGYQSTGLCACCSRYGLVSPASRLAWRTWGGTAGAAVPAPGGGGAGSRAPAACAAAACAAASRAPASRAPATCGSGPAFRACGAPSGCGAASASRAAAGASGVPSSAPSSTGSAISGEPSGSWVGSWEPIRLPWYVQWPPGPLLWLPVRGCAAREHPGSGPRAPWQRPASTLAARSRWRHRWRHSTVNDSAKIVVR